MTVSDIQRPRTGAILQALFVAFLWATSWVLIKFGLQEIPPLVFAGVRYFLAFLILLAVYLTSRSRAGMPAITRQMRGRLFVLGLLSYAVAQGAMFMALSYLSAVTLNLLLNFTNLGVALLGVIWLAERPSGLQWAGITLALAGATVYFLPAAVPRGQWVGMLAAIVCIAANVIATVVGRDINRARLHPPLQVTVVSMGIGATALLATGLLTEGMPVISLRNWGFIAWLAAVNTAFAFTLWNHTLRSLTATESSVCTGTMLVWIPILAVVFLGERITPFQILGLLAVGAGTLLVQLRARGSTGQV